MILISCIVLLSLGLASADGDFDCEGRPNGFFFWWACGSYGICRNGKYIQIDCVNGTSFDRSKRECVKNDRGVSFPCNGGVNCENDMSPGHRYPEMDPDPLDGLPRCTFYYTCANGLYRGHQMCNPKMVYDEATQRCLDPTLVRPPCGSYDGEESYYQELSV